MEVDPNDANFASSNLSERTDVFAIEVPRDIDEELTDDGFANADVTQAKDAMAGRKVIKSVVGLVGLALSGVFIRSKFKQFRDRRYTIFQNQL
ncbi:hypothetical protein AAVH_14942 [Aphelenchoides avenae]|nr:hypothetical protein AAVH_14942 [Aphelenchus avenae]